jgi:hypothetical protein
MYYCVASFDHQSHLCSTANCWSVIVLETGRVSERYTPGPFAVGAKTGHPLDRALLGPDLPSSSRHRRARGHNQASQSIV